MILGLAHEAPIVDIPFIQSVTEFDFAIAHFALKHPKYAEVFAGRPKDRNLIMDNGLFELNTPLIPADVLKAATKTKANYVIAPDVTWDAEAAIERVKLFVALTQEKFKIAAVICGETLEEQYKCYQTYANDCNIKMYCFSFLHRDRAELMKMLYNSGSYDLAQPHHLLGFCSFTELKQCIAYFPGDILTLDTMKPVSAAYHNTLVSEGDQRGKFARPDIGELTLNRTALKLSIEAFAQRCGEIVECQTHG